MKKTFFILVFLFCATSVFCQIKKINFYDTAYFDVTKARYGNITYGSLDWIARNGDWSGYWNTLVNDAFVKKDGIYKIYADTAFTLLAAEGAVVNGKFSGEWKYYYDNHKLRLKCFYVNGELNGPWISYLKNGYKYIETNYVNNERDGVYKSYWFYTDPGDRKYYGKYGTFHYKNGMKQGKTVYWMGDSTVKVSCTYINDKLNGLQVFTNRRGDTLKVEKYEQGRLISERKIENSSYATTYKVEIVCSQKNYQKVDSILSNLGKYKNLEYLSIYCEEDTIYNAIINKHINKISQLQRLNTIRLCGKGFKKIPLAVFSCRNLKSILLEEISIHSLPNELLKLQNLKNIELKYLKLSDPESTITLLSKFQKLKEVLIWECFEQLPPNVHLLQQIDALYLGNYGLCIQKEMQILPNGIFQLKNLKTLQICQKQYEYYHDRFNKEMPKTLVLQYHTCFDKNTTVELQNSRKISIADIKENDVVMAYNTEKQTIDTALVLNVMKHNFDLYTFVTLSLSDGTTVKCTNNHPFWCNSQWIRADKLRKNDVLYLHNEKNNTLQPVTITDIRMSAEEMEVFNITTTKHNYFANSVLVHNK